MRQPCAANWNESLYGARVPVKGIVITIIIALRHADAMAYAAERRAGAGPLGSLVR